MEINIVKKSFTEDVFEVVERKGHGHPDTISDHLAEHLSRNYSNYTREKFGAILHHNFDKLGLLGGASHVEFGKGRLVKPIRVLLNGRASHKFADIRIPLARLLKEWAKDFFKDRLPMIDSERDLEFHFNLSSQSSPGKTDEDSEQEGTRNFWFEPRGLHDLQELTKVVSNDSSIGVGYAPVSALEEFVLRLESDLTKGDFKKMHPWIGSDIKILAARVNDNFRITMCIPQICSQVRSVLEYTKNLEEVKRYTRALAINIGVDSIELSVNTRDNLKTMELYLTVTGSSIESGDEGLVGRGNRVNQIISPNRPMSIEGAAGKNPVYHIGKLYYVAAHRLARIINDRFGIQNEVFMISQSGRLLKNPWLTIVNVPSSFRHHEKLELLIEKEVKGIEGLTNDFLIGKISIS